MERDDSDDTGPQRPLDTPTGDMARRGLLRSGGAAGSETGARKVAPLTRNKTPRAAKTDSGPERGAPVPTFSAGAKPLPFWMTSEGLVHLRDGNFTESARYYEEVARKEAHRAEGWLGMGAALAGGGNVSKAAPYLVRGAEIDKAFPVVTLVAQAQCGSPKLLYDVGVELMEAQTPRSVECASDLFAEVMVAPQAEEPLRLRAERKKVECAKLLESPSSLKAPQVETAGGGGGRVVVMLAIVLILLVGGGFGATMGWKWYKTSSAMSAGMADFTQAAKMTGGEPYDLFYKSLGEFQDAATADPRNFSAQFMVVRSGETIMDLARARKISKTVDPNTLHQIEDQVRRARDRVKELDPSGALGKKEQAALNEALSKK